MTEDSAQLSRYAREGTETAFAEVVNRYLPLVYSAALRQVNGDEQLAKDVAQSVFISLARNARTLSRRPVIAGWLYTATRFIAAKMVRANRRRENRERVLATMQPAYSPPPAEPGWPEVVPVLDQAMAKLKPADRDAVLLRFFERQDLKSVGLALGISEDAARMRVNRALESLRGFLRQRGVVISSAAAIGGLLSSQATAAVPAGLAASITGTALASTFAGAALGTSTVNLLLMTKLKIAVAGLLVTAGVCGPWIVHRQESTRLNHEIQALRLKTQEMDSVLAENSRLSKLLADAQSATTSKDDQFSELLRLRGEVGLLREQANEAKRLRAENRRLQMAATTLGKEGDPKKAKIENLNIQLPRSAWSFAGYRTPEAALQSALWARREGDVNSLVATLTPAFVEQAQKTWGDDFQKGVMSEWLGNLEQISDCRILKKEVVSDDEVKLVYALTEPPRPFGDQGQVRVKSVACGVTAKRFGDEWKFEP